jgi:hypothetical protein
MGADWGVSWWRSLRGKASRLVEGCAARVRFHSCHPMTSGTLISPRRVPESPLHSLRSADINFLTQSSSPRESPNELLVAEHGATLCLWSEVLLVPRTVHSSRPQSVTTQQISEPAVPEESPKILARPRRYGASREAAVPEPPPLGGGGRLGGLLGGAARARKRPRRRATSGHDRTQKFQTGGCTDRPRHARM